ncbi:hypothetical protein [Pseudalkalibacillus berkeleyi]|uniref:Uncharacterized protein n=1 Tax=Pseudalkalibacillus berkeleyi TaxID=1069813 RepID=A0ABS9H410_9BACL|nr:hypothetical protein [Pseudalkalibacillus berkeleyi]MCF6138841.1 hypothetical protein [Pseudalkalibacillus berkeleyi]
MRYDGVIFIIVGLLLMIFSPDIADKWTDYIDYWGDLYYYDYVVRSIIIILIGFGSFVSGMFLLIIQYHFND